MERFSESQFLIVSEQGTKFLCRSPSFSNMDDFKVDACTLSVVDVDIKEPVARCCWRDLVADFIMIG